jgi:hypothetical protein
MTTRYKGLAERFVAGVALAARHPLELIESSLCGEVTLAARTQDDSRIESRGSTTESPVMW